MVVRACCVEAIESGCWQLLWAGAGEGGGAAGHRLRAHVLQSQPGPLSLPPSLPPSVNQVPSSFCPKSTSYPVSVVHTQPFFLSKVNRVRVQINLRPCALAYRPTRACGTELGYGGGRTRRVT
eukprot:2396951-Rhodomonas_salina.1